MKTQRLVFESNSSSSHSISIASVGKLDQTISADDDNIIRIRCGEYGWEFETYSQARDKASYLATYLMNESGEKAKTLREKFIWVVKNFTGAKSVEILPCKEKGWDGGFSYGYIDHRSMDVAENILNKGADGILRFIFSSQSILKTGNDNESE